MGMSEADLTQALVAIAFPVERLSSPEMADLETLEAEWDCATAVGRVERGLFEPETGLEGDVTLLLRKRMPGSLQERKCRSTSSCQAVAWQPF
eukprot:11183227-Lingulodinium_polyedra.AAC.2